MKWKIEKIPELRGYTIEYAAPRNYYISRRNILFHSTSLKPSDFKKIAVVDAPVWKQAASNFRLGQRLLRFMFTNVVPLANGDLFVTFDKSVGIIKNGKFQPLKNLERPCRVLRSAFAFDEKGDIYFGEYLANTKRDEMRVYKYAQGGDALETVYIFPPNSIKHIHGLYFDEFTKAIFCLTGDDEKECRILRSFDNFKTMETIGEGDETWRAVSVLFDKKNFYYGTDAEFRENYIYKVNRQSSEREILGKVDGTVFYSKQLGKDLFFTSTAEDAPIQKENVAALWHIGAGGNCEKLIQFNKDRWHKTLFMFGTIHFPCINKLENELLFHLVGVKEDNQTFRVGI